MSGLLLLVGSMVIFFVAYVTYGSWLCKKWGVDPTRKTPAERLCDNVDYMPTRPAVLMGHHFSSIAGAGPIVGPITAAVFGWVPVMLWILIGSIFFGGVHDFGALYSSIRFDGKTIGQIIDATLGKSGKFLFSIFAYLTLLVVIAAFANIVAATFVASPQAATASLLFIVLAVIFGFSVYRCGLSLGVGTVIGVIMLVVAIAIGNMYPLHLSKNVWVCILMVYIFVASIAPVWILLQPRDYLSSYLLYGMIALALVGIVGAGVTGAATNLDIPAFTGFTAVKGDSKVATTGFLFPALFITIACGAISGFHSLVASGTTSKQLDHESEAQPIAYGGMLLECLVAIISLCAVAFVFDGYMDGTYASPTQVFAGGLSQMLGCIPGLSGAEDIAYSLLILAVSVFCLTSLDTATRLGRYMFQELFIPAGKTREELSGWRKFFSNPVVATLITVTLGVALGLTGYQLVWPLFGAANQLLAALGLLAVCAWLGNAGRNNKMFYVPMVFMLIVTLTSLVLTMQTKFLAIAGGALTLANGLQLVLAVLLAVLAVVLAIKGARVIFGNKKKEIAE